MSSSQQLDEMAKTIYAKLQGDVPSVFKHPEEFNKEYKTVDPNDNPTKLLYRTTNSEYGNFQPSVIEMPTLYKGKGDQFCKMQNYTVYRDSRMNCEKDKNKYMDPYAVIRRK